MTDRNGVFTQLLKSACSGLNLSADELKDKYKDYPICLMEYIESAKHYNVIEVCFDEDVANIMFSINDGNICYHSSIYFDNNSDIDLFVDYLVEAAEYNFRESCWFIDGCYLKIKEVKKEIYFCCYK